jgi:hypothetical protein
MYLKYAEVSAELERRQWREQYDAIVLLLHCYIVKLLRIIMRKFSFG